MYQLSYINRSPPLWNLFGINSWSCSWKIHSTFSNSHPHHHHPLAVTCHGVMLSSVHHWNWITYQNTTDKCFVLYSSFYFQSDSCEKLYRERIFWNDSDAPTRKCDDITELYEELHWWYHWVVLSSAFDTFSSQAHIVVGGWDEIDLFSPREPKFGFKWCWTFFPSRCSDDIWEVHETQLNPTVRFFKTVFYFIWRKTIKTRV